MLDKVSQFFIRVCYVFLIYLRHWRSWHIQEILIKMNNTVRYMFTSKTKVHAFAEKVHEHFPLCSKAQLIFRMFVVSLYLLVVEYVLQLVRLIVYLRINYRCCQLVGSVLKAPLTLETSLEDDSRMITSKFLISNYVFIHHTKINPVSFSILYVQGA